jgi:hypothetical protein
LPLLDIVSNIRIFLYSFSSFLQDGHILVIDPVTAILNLMTAFGLLAVASLVRICPQFKLCRSYYRSGHVCFRGEPLSHVANCLMEAWNQVSLPVYF